MESTTNIGAIILAAGSSSRLGQSKQLIEFQGKSLLENTIHAVRAVVDKRMIVVLGCTPNVLIPLISNADYMINPDWEAGMGNSLKFGVRELQKKQLELDGYLVCVCDQPYLSSEHLKKLREDFEEHPDQIIASVYQGSLGVPVIFPNRFLPNLENIGDDKGAKGIVVHHPNETRKINFERGEIDIDTPEDLDFLRDDPREDQDDQE